MVSIHAPTWGATKQISVHSVNSYRFNPRSHMGSDAFSISVLIINLLFQSTLPHGERPNVELGKSSKWVSIHAPTWGATPDDSNYRHRCKFQSTLPHGERPWRPHPSGCRWCFNPRSHMGSDEISTDEGLGNVFQSTLPHGERLMWLFLRLRQFLVSIHAPTWGATRHSFATQMISNGFNPRSHMGSDAPPAEMRRWSISFNPRSHMGSDY